MRILVALALWAACGGSPPPAPKNSADETPEPVAAAEPAATRSDRQTVELAIRLIGEMAEAAAGSGQMCDEMGRQLSAVAIANEDVFAQLGAIASHPDRAAVLEEHRESLEAATAALFERIGDCGGHPSVSSAMEAMSP